MTSSSADQAAVQQQPAQVVLGGERLGEDDHLAAALARRPLLQHQLDGADQGQGLAVGGQRARPLHERFDPGQLGRDAGRVVRAEPAGARRRRPPPPPPRPRGRRAARSPARRRPRGWPSRRPPQALGHLLQAGRQRLERRGHQAVKPDQQQRALLAAEGVQARLEQVPGDVVVELPLLGAHHVFEQARLPPHERLAHELLRLPAQRALQDGAEPLLQLVLLPLGQHPIVRRAEDLAEGGQVAEQRARGVDVVHQAPQLGQRVLHRRRRQQQHRGPRGGQRLRQPPRHAGDGDVVPQGARAVEPLVDARRTPRGPRRSRTGRTARRPAAAPRPTRCRPGRASPGTPPPPGSSAPPAAPRGRRCRTGRTAPASTGPAAPSASRPGSAGPPRPAAARSPAPPRSSCPAPPRPPGCSPRRAAAARANVTASIWWGLGSIRPARCEAA